MGNSDSKTALFAPAPTLESLPDIDLCGSPADPDSRAVDLWYCHYETVEKLLMAQYPALLLPEERERWLKFHFEKDQNQYLVTRALVRTVLMKYCKCSPMDLRFRRSELGKPELVSPFTDLSFNLSNTRGLIVVAVTRSKVDLGVDVEHLGERAAPMEIAEHYFSSEEQAALALVAPKEKSGAFFTLWTLKEAFIKARGKGLSIPLESFSVLPQSPPVLLDVSGRPDGGYGFATFRTPECLGAVAIGATGINSRTVSLRARQEVPLS